MALLASGHLVAEARGKSSGPENSIPDLPYGQKIASEKSKLFLGGTRYGPKARPLTYLDQIRVNCKGPAGMRRGGGTVVDCKASLILFILLLPTMVWCQTRPTGQSDTPDDPQQTTPSQTNATSAPPSDSGTSAAPDGNAASSGAVDDSKGKQTNRMLWVVPNFGAVSANTQLPPLSTREKFGLAAKDSVTDYSSYTWAAILAGQSFALNSDPELGHGAAGYGRYYWRTFVDGISGTFFTEAIVPSIMHEDPRYYTMERGGFFRRTAYAISRSFVTKSDSGRTVFNSSEVVGNLLEAGLSNAYYPPQERGLNQTARNWGQQMESAVLNHVFQEFWPDIRRVIFRQKK